MKFDRFLDTIVLGTVSRSELLVKLHLAHEEFSGLDQITFTRWKNGITKPSLLKQLLISSTAGCLNEYFEYCEIPQPSINLKSRYEQYLRQFDNHYHALKTDKLKVKYYYYHGDVSSSRTIYSGYFHQLATHKEFVELAEKHNITFDVDVVYRSDKPLSNSSSFALFSTKADKILYILEEVCGLKEGRITSSKYNAFISLSYFSSSESYVNIVGIIFNKLLWSSEQIDNVYFVIRGRESMNFYESIAAKKVCLIEKSNVFGNVYLYEINWKGFIGSPIVIGLISELYDRYNSHNLGSVGESQGNFELKLDSVN